MIRPNDVIRFELQFAAEGFRAHATQLIDQRAADLKMLVEKRCNELSAELDPGWLERQVNQKVDMLWREELDRFVRSEAQDRVYEEMDKLRAKLNAPVIPGRPPRSRR